MADPTNSNNLVWNTDHSGNRVPINDSDSSGAPFTLGSHDESWRKGSANNAIRSTLLLNQAEFLPADLADSEKGKLNLKDIGIYSYRELLYGYKGIRYGGDGIHGSSWRSSVGDLMSLRGYPTVVGVPDGDVYSVEKEGVKYNVDGTKTTTTGAWVHLRVRPLHTLRVLYSVIYRITYQGTTYEALVTGGDKFPYYYRVLGATDWEYLPQGYMFFSEPKPASSTTYSIDVQHVRPTPAYFESGVLEITVGDYELAGVCQLSTTWWFGPEVRIGAISAAYPNPIEEIYNNPAIAYRAVDLLRATLPAGKLGQLDEDVTGDKDLTPGKPVAMGENTKEGICVISEFTGEYIAGQYLWQGTVYNPTTGSENYIVERIWKIDALGNLEGVVIPTGPPESQVPQEPDSNLFYELGFYEPGFHANL